MAPMKHHETVGGHLVASVLRARPGERVREVLARLADEKPTSLELVLGVDAHGRLLGAAPLARIVALPPEAPIEKALERDFPRVRPNTDQEHAASLALHHGVDALPVVDAEGSVLGVMPAQAIMQVLRREHVEDLHVLSGIHREESQARHAIEDPPMRRVRHRLPWLLAGLAGAAVATMAMAGFESTLSAHIAVAFFVPGIVYLADAIGTQSEAVAVRGLSLTRSGIAHLLAGELRTGMAIGASLGLISFLPIWAAFGDVRLAGAVATAVFAAGTMAAALGLLLPWWLARLGRDPALGSGPIATVIQDILSLLVYFAVVRAFGV
jgi:magnesium transporter